MVECLRQAYFKNCFGKCRMRNGVRVNPLQKRLRINCIQIRRELLIKIMLLLVMSHDYARKASHLHQNRRRLHVPQIADEMGTCRTGWDLF
jgi:hypothetical protein